ncbi:30S ribosomal protein S20 [Acholeplasma equirhinis]|uniref:30S ribosomal protein S20 n=1 Tax=Acholeplasma equirhinis TaxID=555393 RepID=UPI00197AA2A2|nr:30S ribosomal protein S20 [Acholeplasma equirhinis]MBN3490579.1 30S ribosomal protein S20 [Acholeplasma equirhinis]
MANIKSQIKRNKTNEKARQANVALKSSYKTSAKAIAAAVAAGDKEKALSLLSLTFKKLDKGQAKGVFHKNFVARHKSALSKQVNALA